MTIHPINADRIVRPSRLGLWQAGLAVLGLAVLVFLPPAQGRMLLVPLTPTAAHRLVGFALDRDALLVASGPVPGSLVVEGRRRDLLGSGLARRILVLASARNGCGAGAPPTGSVG